MNDAVISHPSEESKRNLLKTANDMLAVVYICASTAFVNNVNLVFVSLALFGSVTFLNAYLEGRRLNLFILWGVFFYGFCLLSRLWANNPAGTSAYVGTMIRMMLLSAIISMYSERSMEVDIVFKSVIISAGILAFRLAVSTSFEDWGAERVGANVGMNANGVGVIFACASVACLNYANKAKPYLLLFALYTALTMFTGSRRAFILIFIVVLLFFINNIKKPSSLFYIIPFGAVMALLVYVSMNNPTIYSVLGVRLEGLLNLTSGEGKVDASTLVRMDLISIGISLFKENMLIGYGINSFQYMNKYSLYSHNNYIELLVNFGLIGTILYYIVPVAVLLKSVVIWMTKTREVIIAIVFMTITLVGDYGTISYDSTLNIIILAASYRAVVIWDARPKAIASEKG